MSKVAPEASADVLWDLLQTSDDPHKALAALLKARPELLAHTLQEIRDQRIETLQEIGRILAPWQLKNPDRYERNPIGFPFACEAFVKASLNASYIAGVPLKEASVWVAYARAENGLFHVLQADLNRDGAMQEVDQYLQDRHVFLLDGAWKGS